MATEEVTVDEHDVLAERFESHRLRLRGVAYRMLGSLSKADDAVQESWLRLSCREPGWHASKVVRGASAVTAQTLTFSRLAGFAQPALMNGAAGLVTRSQGTAR
jgi:hypothetical protein